MVQKTRTAEDLFRQILDPVNRPNPYPLYAELRKTPVIPIDENFYAVSTFADVSLLLHDPRAGKVAPDKKLAQGSQAMTNSPPFLALDPPEHDRLRAIVIRQFTPERVNGMHQRIVELVDELLDAQRGQQEIDIVEQFSYPLPVAVICELLGIPREDEKRFHVWADILAHNLDPDPGQEGPDPNAMQALFQLGVYMNNMINTRRAEPQNDLLSGLATGKEMDDRNLIATLILLLIAGHETTVNLITNATLTLLRYPAELQRLREQPERAIHVVEEVLRYEPPVQFIPRFARADIQLEGGTIPAGSGIRLMNAAANRDPQRHPDPERFNPDRPNNEHLGFGGGVHYCVGAPLARIEAQIALNALARRLVNPQLVSDPPPYRPNAVLRGPSHLPVKFERIT